MKRLFLHLSDFHFSSKNFLNEAQIRAIAAAGFSISAVPDEIYIVLSGDIAATGKREDYEIADAFLRQLLDFLESVTPRKNIHILTVPGNHDIDDSVLREAGDILANEVLQNGRLPSEARSTYELLLSAQHAYWDFDNRWSAAPTSSLEDKLFRRVSLDAISASEQITFELFNTAFLSRRHETQGRLWFPVDSAKKALDPQRTSDNLSIAVFHHPYVWLESNNSTKFREIVESLSDVALNGHQHSPESYFVTSLSSTQIWYSAGAALIGKDTNDSGFVAMQIDSTENTRRLASFSFNGSLYISRSDTGNLLIPTLGTRRGISFTEEFADYLDDPETLIVHTQKKNVLLQDIYEPPRLRGGETRTTKSSMKTLTLSKISDVLKTNEALFIFGDTLSGKTCLAKNIFRQLFRRDGSMVPLLLSGRNLEFGRTRDIERWCARAVRRQFKGMSVPEYRVLPREMKVAIVDDWHSLALGEEAKRNVMKELCAQHNHTILICDSWYQAQELTTVLDSTDPLLPKNHFTILPYTPYQRSSMIRRWLLLGRPDDVTDAEVVYRMDAAEKYLDELHRSGLMPPYPLYVLTALQMLQAMQQSEPDLGAQGVLFDILVGDKLKEMSADAPELDINRQFIAFIAHDIFSREERASSVERVGDLAKEFIARFAVPIKVEPLLEALVHHKVLYRADGVVTFRHRYMYYYFVAEHIVSLLQKRASYEAMMKQLKEMTKFVAFEEYAQVLMFVIYRTRNEELIDELVENSKAIYKGIEPSDLESDLAFANRLDISAPNLLLSGATVSENRDAERKQLLEESNTEPDDNLLAPDPGAKVTYTDDLDWGAKMQFAFKTTQTLGRVLRNFPGTLDAGQKKDLAVNAIGSSLRMLRHILGEAEKEKEGITAHLQHAVDASETLTAAERATLADARLMALITLCGYAIVRFLATAIGSPKLEVTLSELRDEMPDVPSIQLINIAIRMDHYRDMPIDRLFDLEAKLGRNVIAHEILRMLVWHRVTYFPTENRRVLASICTRFDIKLTSAPILLANSSSRSK